MVKPKSDTEAVGNPLENSKFGRFFNGFVCYLKAAVFRVGF